MTSMNEPTKRTCSICGETKPLSMFFRDAAQPLGYERRCKECRRKSRDTDAYRARETARAKLAYAKDPEKHRGNTRRYREKNRDNPIYLEARRATTRKWHRANPRKVKDGQLRAKYGITIDQYEAMFAAQGGACAICGETSLGLDAHGKRMTHFPVDHDSETGIVRGLLCGRCNVGIGQFRHRSHLLRSAIRYLSRTLR